MTDVRETDKPCSHEKATVWFMQQKEIDMRSGHAGEKLSLAIVSAVAEHEDIHEREFIEPLYDSMDPEALATLFQGCSGRVTFQYLGYRVTVDHEHNVTVAEERR